MKKIAIPKFKNNDVGSFGKCLYYNIFELDNKLPIEDIKPKRLLVPKHIAISEIPEWIAQEGVTDVVVYYMPDEIISLFAIKKIQLYVGISETNTEEILKQLQAGLLRSNTSKIKE